MKTTLTYYLAILLASFVFFTSCQKDDFIIKNKKNHITQSNLTKSVIATTTSTVNLLAGQNIQAGTIITNIINDILYVKYNTSNGFELNEAHLFVGTDINLLPSTRTGNPKVGHFPYIAENLSGTEFTFSIPLSEVLSGNDYCDKTLFISAHASLKKLLPNGAYQNETGWGAGIKITEYGNWGTYFFITIQCKRPIITESNCETAFAYGEISLINLGITNSRWGWVINVNSTGTYSNALYARAGQNIISNGYYVGDIVYQFDGKTVNISYNLRDGYYLTETHLYLSASLPSNIAPGQYGNSHNYFINSTTDSYTLPMFESNFYIVAHAVVCHVNQ